MSGASSDLGRLLVPLLASDPRVDGLVVFDVARPPGLPERVSFEHVDLLMPSIEQQLEHSLRAAQLDAFVHLAFVNSKVHRASFAHELEVVGTLRLLAAIGAVGIRRLVVPSLTVLYGARPTNPTYATEKEPLQPVPGVRFVNDRIAVEHQLAEFAARASATEVVIVRCAPLVGPTSNNPFTRLVRTRVVPTVLGFDPLWQVLHEDDAARALHLALFSRAIGVFNVVGEGVAPISALLRVAGASVLPLPGPLLRSTLATMEVAGLPASPWALMDFFRYAWLADGAKARRHLHFLPRTSVLDAMASMARRN